MFGGPRVWAVAAAILAGGCRPSSGDGSAPPAPPRSEPVTFSAAPAPGTAFSPAPSFSLKDAAGRKVSLSEFKGKVVFIDFWATWCPPCRISLPAVERLYTDYQGKPVQVLGLNLDEDAESVMRFLKKKEIPYPVLFAGESDIASQYGVSGIPHFALVDSQGRLVNEWAGYAPGFPQEWRDAIDRLLGV